MTIHKGQSGEKGLFESDIIIDGKKIRHLQICHREKRAKKLHKIVSKRLKTNFISRDVHIKKEFVSKYISQLNFNALIHIIRQHQLNEVTVYDPKCLIAHRLQGIMQYVKFLRVITDNTDTYESYNEECFEIMGCCAAISSEFPKGKQQLIFCTSPLPENYDTKGAFIIGECGYTSVIDSSLSAEATDKRPQGIDITDFFTVLAVICSCPTLLNAVPQFLQMDKTIKNIGALIF